MHIDGAGNAVGVRKGKGGGPKVVVDGHMDTVYAEDTPLEPTFDGEFIHCPGIVDDTRALAAMLSLIRALDAAGVETDGDLVFTGTVREEGMGAFGGDVYKRQLQIHAVQHLMIRRLHFTHHPCSK